MLSFCKDTKGLLVLCAFGDACTGTRHEATTTWIRRLKDTSIAEFQAACKELEAQVTDVLLKQGIKNYESTFEIDLRYRGQATNLPVLFSLDDVLHQGFQVLEER